MTKTNPQSAPSTAPPSVQVEISLEKLESLIRDGHLCASQIRCLNLTSKHHIQNLCLNACAYTLCQAKYSAAESDTMTTLLSANKKN